MKTQSKNKLLILGKRLLQIFVAIVSPLFISLFLLIDSPIFLFTGKWHSLYLLKDIHSSLYLDIKEFNIITEDKLDEELTRILNDSLND